MKASAVFDDSNFFFTGFKTERLAGLVGLPGRTKTAGSLAADAHH